ncbi:MAG: hypothetical protein ACT4P4_04120 [Betaproteobacteria bacterium]
MNIKALEELEKKLRELQDKLDRLEQEHEVPLSEVLSDDFISGHTPYPSATALFEAGGFKTGEIQEEKMDAFIRSVSKFQNWQDLVNAAAKEWSARKLGF